MKNDPQWKKLLALVLCVVQCMVLAVPAVSAEEVVSEGSAADVLDVTSLVCDVPLNVTLKEEDTYWWGNASQATVKLGEPIINIGDRESIIFDSPVEEGYSEKDNGTSGLTSNYFEVNTNWAKIDVDKQDLMFYIELPQACTSIRIKHICVSPWLYPAASGMVFQYLAADGSSWIQGAMDTNNQINLPAGFKGYIRLLLNTASNYDSFKNTTSMQYIGLRFGSYGGSIGAAKLGGMWLVDKGEAYRISIDGGDPVALTTANPLPKPGGSGESAWEGDALTIAYQNHETGTIGGMPSQVTLQKDQNWWGNPTQVTFQLTEGITKLGDTYGYVIDSPIGEGYGQPTAKTAPFFNLFGSWSKIDILTQDFMFYIELPEVCQGLRLHGFTCTAANYCWPGVGGMQYQYLEMDSYEWFDGTVSNDSNKTLMLPAGFKGYVRMKMDTASNFSSLPSTNLSIERMQFYIDRFGGSDGAVKIGGVWVVSKENTRYAKLGGATVCMTNPAEVTWIKADSSFVETGVAGEAAATTVWYDKGWGRTPLATATVGECINPLNDGQKSIIMDSEQHEGYTLDDSSERSYPSFRFHADSPTVNMAKNQLMIYVELPERASSIRVDSFYFYCGGTVLTPSPDNMKYAYLPIDGEQWIDGGVSNGNYTFGLTPGFKGYVRFDVGGGNAWWQNHNSDDTSWKNSVATLAYIEMRYERFGADLGAAKFGGLWVIDKGDYTEVSVDGGDVQPMTSYANLGPVMKATSVAKEDPLRLWSVKVSVSGGAQKADDFATADIWDVRGVKINSTELNGYANGGDGAFAVDILSDITQEQDIMLYVELPNASKALRVQNPAVVSYKYLPANADQWEVGVVGENGQIDLPAGFDGYVRLVVDAGYVDQLVIRPDAFGGDLGAVRLGGTWLVSGNDAVYVRLDGGEPIAIYEMFMDWIDVEKQPSDYSIVIIPDQQMLTYYNPGKLNNMYQWIAEQIEPENVQMVLNLGDITDDNSTLNWERAKGAYEIIAGQVPYICVPGNHDYDMSLYHRDLSRMNQYFPLSMFKEMDTYGGSYSEDMGLEDDVANTWQTFEVSGNKYLILGLEFGPRDSVLAWANDVIAAHPEHQVIVFTHGYLDYDGTRLDGNGDGAPSDYIFTSGQGEEPCNDADAMWDKLIRKHENIVMVLSGHIGSDNVVCKTELGDHGNEVKQILIDAQVLDMTLDGLGMVAMMNFSNDGQTVEFTYYCTDKSKYMNYENQFTFTLPVQEKNYVAQVGEQTYATVTEAIANANGQTVTILADSDEAITVSADVTVDLAGFDLSNVTVAEGAKLNLIDSTATYEGVSGSAAVTGNVEFLTEADGSKYMVIGENGVYAPHLYDFGITHVSLKPGVTGFGYKAGFYGDAAVQAQIVSVGFELWLTEEHVVGRSMDGYKEQVTLRLQNFLVSEYGEAPVNAKVVMTLTDGTKLESQTVSYSMRSMLEQVNTNIAQFNDAQIRAVQEMLAPYADTVSTWNISDILHWSFSEAA